MKRYMEESEAVADRAAVIAWITDDAERISELTALFQDCGTIARIYAHPATVARLLVSVVVENYQSSRAVVQGRFLVNA